MESIIALIKGMGIFHLQWGQAVMIAVSLLLLWLAISRKFEPLLLLPIGFGGLLSNIPEAGLAMTALENLLHLGSPEQIAVIAAQLGVSPDLAAIKTALNSAPISMVNQLEALSVDMGYSAGILALFYKVAISYGIAPLVIFMGVGAMTDFGPLLANPKTLLLGAAAQFGIFATVLGALALNYFGIIEFTLPQAASIGIIGGADGPTAIYLTSKLAPELLGAIAVAAYSYMALVPLIQPPIMKALTTEEERKIRMTQMRHVSNQEKVLFPVILLLLVGLLLPDAAPLLGMFCFGILVDVVEFIVRVLAHDFPRLSNRCTALRGGALPKLSLTEYRMGLYPSCSERRALMHTSVRLPLAAVANLAQAVHQDGFGGDHTLAIDHRIELLVVGDRGEPERGNRLLFGALVLPVSFFQGNHGTL